MFVVVTPIAPTKIAAPPIPPQPQLGTGYDLQPTSPFRGSCACVTRERPEGGPRNGWEPQEKISLEDCIRAYTPISSCSPTTSRRFRLRNTQKSACDAPSLGAERYIRAIKP